VLGGAVGVLLPSHDGALGFWVVGGVLVVVSVVLLLRNRALRRAAARRSRRAFSAQPAPDAHRP
jgi:uncharacterized membrane protein YfcA